MMLNIVPTHPHDQREIVSFQGSLNVNDCPAPRVKFFRLPNLLLLLCYSERDRKIQEENKGLGVGRLCGRETGRMLELEGNSEIVELNTFNLQREGA